MASFGNRPPSILTNFPSGERVSIALTLEPTFSKVIRSLYEFGPSRGVSTLFIFNSIGLSVSWIFSSVILTALSISFF
jgi:hypothetical protein